MSQILIKTHSKHNSKILIDKCTINDLCKRLTVLMEHDNRRDIELCFEPGYHDLIAPIHLTSKQLPTRGYRCELTSLDPTQSATLRASLPVTGWKSVQDLDDIDKMDLNPAIQCAELPEGAELPRALYAHGQRMPNARSEYFLPELIAGQDPHRITRIPEGILPKGYPLDNLILSLLPKQKWVHNRLPIQHGHAETGEIQVNAASTYELAPIGYGWFPEGNAWIENNPSDINAPGQWAIDYLKRSVYWWPLPDVDVESVRVPVCTEMLLIEGQIDHDGLYDQCVDQVHLCHLNFTENDAYVWSEDHVGLGIQHDWEMYDAPSAALRLRGATHCSIQHCKFIQLASTGVRLDLSAQHHEIHHNQLKHIGGIGILASGYGSGLKDTNTHHKITNNQIAFVGESHWHSPAIMLWQSGHNLVQRNHISYCPYTGIVISGRFSYDRSGQGECSKTIRWSEVNVEDGAEKDWGTWFDRECYQHARHNQILQNDISRVMMMMGDGNGIYLSGAGGHNLIAGNFIHDNDAMLMNAAIRSDDDQHQTCIRDNLITRSLGEGILIKGVSEVTGNILIDLSTIDEQGEPTDYLRGYFVNTSPHSQGSVFMDNCIISTVPDHCLLFTNKGKVQIDELTMDRNYYWNMKQSNWAEAHLGKARSVKNEGLSEICLPDWWPADLPDAGNFTEQHWSRIGEALSSHPLLNWAGPLLSELTPTVDHIIVWPCVLIKYPKKVVMNDEE